MSTGTEQSSYTRGAWRITDVDGPATQRVAGFVNQQPRSFGRIVRNHREYVRALYSRGAAYDANMPTWPEGARAVSAALMCWQLLGAAVFRFLTWAFFSDHVVRNLINAVITVAVILYLIWS